MGLKKIQTKKLKKKTVRSRARTGLAGIPIEKGFDAVKDYFHIEVDKKDCINSVKTWIKKNFNKTDAKYILINPEWKFTFSHHGAIAFWDNNGFEKTEITNEYRSGLLQRMPKLLEEGKILYKEKQMSDTDIGNVITLSPQEKLVRKIKNTIMQELLELEDKWIDGDDATFNIYDRFKYHGLTNTAISHVKPMIEGWLLDYEDAYHKRCDQAVEGYSHLKRSALNQRIKTCQLMLDDLERIRSATKASRTINIKKPTSADKQVAKIQYKKEDNDFKIVSIHPIQIIGKTRLYIFNTKYREMCYYETAAPRGFEISGTTIKNFDRETSFKIKFRKPLEFFPIILTKNFKQITKFLEDNAKSSKRKEANGRINKDTILLRVLDQ
jgi:hypothetical protein